MKAKLTAARRKAGLDLRDAFKPQEDLNPQPKAWPMCSTCKQSFVLRRAMVFDVKAGVIDMQWCWQRDCKHKKAKPITGEVGS